MSMSSARRCDLDWLRIAAFGLLILYHVGMVFVPWDFHIKLARLDWLEPWMRFINAWRLSLLFVISGAASAAMLRKGADGFLASRSRRLLLPLLFGVIIVVPPQSWVEVQGSGAWAGPYPAFWAGAYFDFSARLGPILPTWNHLWFVAYLWLYTLVLGVGLWLPAGLRVAIVAGARRLLCGARLLWLPMLAMAAINITMADAWQETHDVVHDLRAHLIYGGAFAIGLALGPDGPLWPAVVRWWRQALGLGLIGWLAALGLLAMAEPPMAAVRAMRAVQAWGMIIGLLGAARQWLAFDHAWRQPLAEAVFPAYLIHQTIIILIAWWVRDLPLAAQAGLVLGGTVLGTAGFCWLTAQVGWLRPLVGYGPVRPAPAAKPLRA